MLVSRDSGSCDGNVVDDGNVVSARIPHLVKTLSFLLANCCAIPPLPGQRREESV